MSTSAADQALQYLSGVGVEDYLRQMREQHPALAATLDPDRLAAVSAQPWLAEGNEFDDDDTGRGSSYRRAQLVEMARVRGIRTVLAVLTGSADGPDDTEMILDVLGGDGLLSRVWRTTSGAAPSAPVPLITGDMSARMVEHALAAGLPAVRQRAHELVHADETLDGVLLAYGTHHLGLDERAAAAHEAYRVLKPGGRVAMHDFDQHGQVSTFFGEVVARHSLVGHPYPHFTAEEMAGYLTAAGFQHIDVRPIYDPIVTTGDTRQAALDALADYMSDMYGLVRLTAAEEGRDAYRARVLDVLDEVFRYTPDELPGDGSETVTRITADPDGSGYRAELPRVALLATATKPSVTPRRNAPCS